MIECPCCCLSGAHDDGCTYETDDPSGAADLAIQWDRETEIERLKAERDELLRRLMDWGRGVFATDAQYVAEIARLKAELEEAKRG